MCTVTSLVVCEKSSMGNSGAPKTWMISAIWLASQDSILIRKMYEAITLMTLKNLEERHSLTWSISKGLPGRIHDQSTMRVVIGLSMV